MFNVIEFTAPHFHGVRIEKALYLIMSIVRKQRTINQSGVTTPWKIYLSQKMLYTYKACVKINLANARGQLGEGKYCLRVQH